MRIQAKGVQVATAAKIQPPRHVTQNTSKKLSVQAVEGERSSGVPLATMSLTLKRPLEESVFQNHGSPTFFFFFMETIDHIMVR